jgi:hypothetical protein
MTAVEPNGNFGEFTVKENSSLCVPRHKRLQGNETTVLFLVHSTLFLFHGLESNNLFTFLLLLEGSVFCTCGICTKLCVYRTMIFACRFVWVCTERVNVAVALETRILEVIGSILDLETLLSCDFIPSHPVYIVTRLVTIDGVWIGNRIYLTLTTLIYNSSANSHTSHFTKT